jgi:hypothetical protein
MDVKLHPSEMDSILASTLLAISRNTDTVAETTNNQQESPQKDCLTVVPFPELGKALPGKSDFTNLDDIQRKFCL